MLPNPILSIHVPCFQMPWWLKEPGHQQSWHWPNKPEYSVSLASEGLNSCPKLLIGFHVLLQNTVHEPVLAAHVIRLFTISERLGTGLTFLSKIWFKSPRDQLACIVPMHVKPKFTYLLTSRDQWVNRYASQVLTLCHSNDTNWWMAEHYSGNVVIIQFGLGIVIKQTFGQFTACCDGHWNENIKTEGL